MRTFLAVTVILFASTPALSATLEVGAGKTYTTIAAAAAAARDGDTIDIHAGTYSVGAAFTRNDLIVRRAPTALPGSVRVTGLAREAAVVGKGLFVTQGANITIEGIRFEGARNSYGNGAGIRAEGNGLTVRDSAFVGNEMGILATPSTTKVGPLTVSGTTFDLTKAQLSGRLGHALYANNISTLTVAGSTFTRTTGGHYIKSRALSSVITDNTIDDTDGSGAYLIDLPEGGGATIRDNRLTKGAAASNCCVAISYGAEMHKGGSYVNAAGPVTVANNILVNRRASTVYFVYNKSKPVNGVALSGNTLTALAGRIVPLLGTGTVSSALAMLEDGLAMTAFMAGDPMASDWSGGQVSLAAVERAAEAQVPAPATLALFGLGSLALALQARQRSAA